jgi:hypothetical protein
MAADLSQKQVELAKRYSNEFSGFLTAYYRLTNVIGRAADAGIVWSDAVLVVDPTLKHLDAAGIVAAEALITQLATYLATSGRRQILEAMTPS